MHSSSFRYPDAQHARADYPGTSYNTRIQSPETGYQIWINAFDGYYNYGFCYMTMFHPQIIGKPGGVMLLDQLLNYIERFPALWYSTAEGVARH